MRKYRVILACLWIVAGLMIAMNEAKANEFDGQKVQIPIYFIGDRRPKTEKRGEKTPDQLIVGQHIRAGVIQVPLVTSSKKIDENMAKQLEWKTLERKDKVTPVIIQAERSSSALMNFGAGGGTVTPFQIESFEQNSVIPFKNYLVRSKSKRFILFVHGCCCSVEDSFKRAAELALSSKLPVFMFDWATPGKYEAPLFFEFHSYRRSERVLEISQHNYYHVLSCLTKHLDQSCILIGHSMGNRLICTDLLQRCSKRDLFFDQVHLVRPDMSLPAFLLDEHRVCRFARRVYVYMADNDPELRKAQWLSAGVPRLGRPMGLFEEAARQGMTFDRPANRYYIDIKSLELGHRMPMELIASIIKNGPISRNGFQFVPWSNDHTKEKVLFVKANDSKNHVKSNR